MTLRTLSPRVPTHAKKQTNAQLSQQEWLRHAAAATPAELFCELNSGEEGLRGRSTRPAPSGAPTPPRRQPRGQPRCAC